MGLAVSILFSFVQIIPLRILGLVSGLSGRFMSGKLDSAVRSGDYQPT
jgi:hypothetical protein